MSYLGDFLFSPARAQSPVSSLSGGERARLLLARLFARPANVLVMDEPTNDLDIETLELLEELLQNFDGTVLLVSHDRSFLDNVITQTIAYEGNGKWRDYVGGYEDWLQQRPRNIDSTVLTSPTPSSDNANATKLVNTTPNEKTERNKSSSKSKLSPWEAKELENIPEKISVLEAKQAELTEKLSSPELYQSGNAQLLEVQSAISEVEEQLMSLFERWELLESKVK